MFYLPVLPLCPLGGPAQAVGVTAALSLAHVVPCPGSEPREAMGKGPMGR